MFRNGRYFFPPAQKTGLRTAVCYLGDVEVEAEALAFTLHLPHTQRAGELTRAHAHPLQREGAVQTPLCAAPDVVEWDLLYTHTHTEGM